MNSKRNEAGRPKWTVVLSAVLLVGLLLSEVSPASAHGDDGESPVDPASITFDQNLGASLPLDVGLTDENGESVVLSQYFGEKPVLLLFAYYDCPMLCTLALEDLANNLNALKDTAGEDFEVLTISFSAGETPEMAAAKKTAYTNVYRRPGGEEGWHFLVGEQPAIDRLTETAGFHYQYDPESGEYAHPTGVIALTPGGKIVRYIFGIDYDATDLRLALLDASEGKTASPIDQVFLLCYQYDPVTGQYTVAINKILRIAGIGTTLVLAGGILFLSVKTGRRRPGDKLGGLLPRRRREKRVEEQKRSHD